MPYEVFSLMWDFVGFWTRDLLLRRHRKPPGLREVKPDEQAAEFQAETPRARGRQDQVRELKAGALNILPRAGLTKTLLVPAAELPVRGSE